MNKWVEYQELPGQDGLRKLNERLLFKKEDFKDATVLDLGCWAGQIMLQSKKWGAKEVFGVDIDSDVVVLGRKFGNNIICDDLENPFFWRGVKSYDVVLLLSILGNVNNPEMVISQAALKTNKVMYVEGHGSYHKKKKEEWVDLFMKYTDFTTIEYLGDAPDRALFRLSRETLSVNEVIDRVGDRILITGKPGAGKTYISGFFKKHKTYSDPPAEDLPDKETKEKFIIDSSGSLEIADAETAILVVVNDRERIKRIETCPYSPEFGGDGKFGRRAFEFSKSPTYKAKFVNFYTIKN